MISAQFSGDSADGITSCPVRTAQEDVNSSSRPAFLSFAHCSTLETHQYPDPARGEHSLCHRFVWVRMSGDSTKEQPNYARPTTSSRTAALAERVSRSAQKPASAESRKQLQTSSRLNPVDTIRCCVGIRMPRACRACIRHIRLNNPRVHWAEPKDRKESICRGIKFVVVVHQF